jgi:hypothetical protein
MNFAEQIKHMKAEDKAYGERPQKKNQQVKVKSKNQPNFARMSMQGYPRLFYFQFIKKIKSLHNYFYL